MKDISEQTIILFTIKKYKKRDGYGTAKTYQTNPPITKSNDWNQ